MHRGIIINDGVPHVRRVRAGVQWLIDRGGGTIWIPLWKDFEDYFGERRTTYERWLGRQGIKVEKMTGYSFAYGDSLVLYPDEKDLRALEGDGDTEHDGDIMVVEWVPAWLDWWRDAYDVDEYTIGDGEGHDE